jgi:aminoglycoside phosphotransferase (APT) family kinase protein
MSPLTLSDDEIVQLCQRLDSNHLNILSKPSSGRKVFKVTDEVVVKFGLGVTLQEARAQQLAYQNVSSGVLRIPRIYRFFSRQEFESYTMGYLVMENIEGINLEQSKWEDSDILPRIVKALNALHSIPGEYPGPISGGEAQGSLWSEYGSGTSFREIRDLEFYLNERLMYFGTAIQVKEGGLCLCHMDTAPRNFMIDLEGRLCLLDWATAGFYPRYFELWSIEFGQHVMGDNFGISLLRYLDATPEETVEVQKLTLVYRYNSHYAM